MCDTLMAKIATWLQMYERGDESASRPFVTLNGRIVDRVTMYAYRIRFKTQEIDHLVRLLHALAEHQELTSDFTRVRQGMTKLKLVPGGEYEVTLNFFKQDVALATSFAPAQFHSTTCCRFAAAPLPPSRSHRSIPRPTVQPSMLAPPICPPAS